MCKTIKKNQQILVCLFYLDFMTFVKNINKKPLKFLRSP